MHISIKTPYVVALKYVPKRWDVILVLMDYYLFILSRNKNVSVGMQKSFCNFSWCKVQSLIAYRFNTYSLICAKALSIPQSLSPMGRNLEMTG